MKIATLLFVCLAAFATTARARPHSTTATGRVLCRVGGKSVPMKEVMVKVIDDDFIFDDVIAQTTTGEDGRFMVSGQARDFWGIPHIYVAIFHTYLNILEIDGFFGNPRVHRSPTKPITQTTNFGDIYITDDHCKAYVHFYDAVNDYTNRTELGLPYGTLHVCTQAFIHGGTPYALTNKVVVPSNYPLTLETAKHEVAHTVRHSIDGNLGHLAYDAVRFNYFRQHYCSLKTNEGFAFNEGWAQFWAGSCKGSFYGNSPSDYTIEGNVANALRQLQVSYGLSDFDMVDMLDSTNTTIHSFTEYQTAVVNSYIYGY